MNLVGTQCPNPILPGDLLDYFTHRLSPEQEGVVEAHLAQCDVCAAQAWQAHTFAASNHMWTATAHGAAYHEAHHRLPSAQEASTLTGTRALARLLRQISEALRFLERGEAFGTLRDSIRCWRERLASDVASAASELARAALTSRSTGAGVLEALQRWGWSWVGLSPSPAWSAVYCASPAEDQPAAGTKAVVWARPNGVARLQVDLRLISDDPREAEVRVTGVPPETEFLLVVLLPSEPGLEPRCAELKKEDVAVWTARFAGIAPAAWTVALSPLRLQP